MGSLRVKLVPLPKEREKAYYAGLRALAEIIRTELEREFSQTHSLVPSPHGAVQSASPEAGEGRESGKEAVAVLRSTS